MYARVFASLWDGTLGGNWEAWSLFVFMLANCDREGYIDMTHSALSRRSGIPLEAVKRAIEALEAPDPDSRSQECEGRRLERLDQSRDWGWRIVNRVHYANLKDLEDIRAQNRERQRLSRMSRGVTSGHTGSRGVTNGHTGSLQAEVEADTEATNASDFGSLVGFQDPVPFGSVSPEKTATHTRWTQLFDEFWAKYPHFKRRSHRKPAISAWNAIKPRSTAQFTVIMAGLDAAIASPDWQKNSGEYVEAAERWLRRAGWDASNGSGPPRDVFAEFVEKGRADES